MSDDYTPETMHIRIAYAYVDDLRSEQYRDREAAFDRWLAAHDRQVRAEAWDEGFDAGRDDIGAALVAIEHGEDLNPYREGK